MLVKYNEIVHQKQPCKWSCAATCVAMATGVDVNITLDIAAEYGLHLPLEAGAVYGMLVKADILPVKVDNLIHASFDPNRIYIVDKASGRDKLHSILIVNNIDNGKVYIYDPELDSEYVFQDGGPRPVHVSVEALYDCSGYFAE